MKWTIADICHIVLDNYEYIKATLFYNGARYLAKYKYKDKYGGKSITYLSDYGIIAYDMDLVCELLHCGFMNDKDLICNQLDDIKEFLATSFHPDDYHIVADKELMHIICDKGLAVTYVSSVIVDEIRNPEAICEIRKHKSFYIHKIQL